MVASMPAQFGAGVRGQLAMCSRASRLRSFRKAESPLPAGREGGLCELKAGSERLNIWVIR